MNKPRRKPSHHSQKRRSSSGYRTELLKGDSLHQRELGFAEDHEFPVVEVRAPTWSPLLYRKRLGQYDPKARYGDVVKLIHRDGQFYGYGLFNPRAELSVRLLSSEPESPGMDFWKSQLQKAIELREQLIDTGKVNAYRVVHAEGDGLSGLVVDRFADVISLECFSLAMYQRAGAIADLLQQMTGVQHFVVRTGPQTATQEGFDSEPLFSEDCPDKTKILEYGTTFEVDFERGHKTGFFCDQRENRMRIAQLAQGKTMLDICCYSGGFAVQAAMAGASEVSAIDLDEEAIEMAKRNANLNQKKIRFRHCDAFPFLKDAIRESKQYETVVLDPPKLISSKAEFEEGKQAYFDMNRLAMQCVKPGGWMLTCSCSGQLSAAEFQTIIGGAVPQGRRVQVLEKRGPGIDHPIATNCPEGEYLKAFLLRVE